MCGEFLAACAPSAVSLPASRNTPAQDLGVGAGLEGRRFAFVKSVKYTHTASNDLWNT